MPRRANESLFADEPAAEVTPDAAAPLAERIRPRTLTEFVGQQHLVGEGRVLRRVIEGGGLLPCTRYPSQRGATMKLCLDFPHLFRGAAVKTARGRSMC